MKDEGSLKHLLHGLCVDSWLLVLASKSSAEVWKEETARDW